MDRFSEESSGIFCTSNVEDLYQIEYSSKHLFIGTWSISETPIEFRNKFDFLFKKCDLFLIAYQTRFEEANNIEYFINFKQRFSTINWRDMENKYIKNSRYLFGNLNDPA